MQLCDHLLLLERARVHGLYGRAVPCGMPSATNRQQQMPRVYFGRSSDLYQRPCPEFGHNETRRNRLSKDPVCRARARPTKSNETFWQVPDRVRCLSTMSEGILA